MTTFLKIAVDAFQPRDDRADFVGHNAIERLDVRELHHLVRELGCAGRECASAVDAVAQPF